MSERDQAEAQKREALFSLSKIAASAVNEWEKVFGLQPRTFELAEEWDALGRESVSIEPAVDRLFPNPKLLRDLHHPQALRLRVAAVVRQFGVEKPIERAIRAVLQPKERLQLYA
ncbi:hypothetical protein [Fulvimarina manganoxydans]|uniref:hypothetical protein n=1 Tax=Fulvimarina manganoxydans TaxID=937218 RepID=UPI00111C6CAB|nr:hypothetical protein [Fulvimarina manganoxydans]